MKSILVIAPTKYASSIVSLNLSSIFALESKTLFIDTENEFEFLSYPNLKISNSFLDKGFEYVVFSSYSEFDKELLSLALKVDIILVVVDLRDFNLEKISGYFTILKSIEIEVKIVIINYNSQSIEKKERLKRVVLNYKEYILIDENKKVIVVSSSDDLDIAFSYKKPVIFYNAKDKSIFSLSLLAQFMKKK